MARQSLIAFRRGTAATWSSANPVLSNGEPGYESDTNKVKIGDGSTAWSSLAYVTGSGGSVAADTIWDVKGDIAVASGADAASRLAVGTDGWVLTADSTQTLGVKWGVGTAGPTGPASAGQLWITAAGLWPSTTSGASLSANFETTTNKQNVFVMDFANAAVNNAEANLMMPSDWNGGTVTAQFVWMVNGTGAGSVVWGLQGRSYADAETLDQAWGTQQTVTDNGSGTANQVLISAATSAITLGGSPAASRLTLWRVQRLNSGTLSAIARLLGVMVTFTRV